MLEIKKLDENAIIPKYMTKNAVGFDVHALNDHIIKKEHGVTFVRTGLAVAIPEDHEINVRARSGLSLKYPNYVAISGGGTIDSDYRGEIKVPVINNTDDVWFIKKGDRIAQCIISPVKVCELVVVDELSETERGTGGFGHTGR